MFMKWNVVELNPWYTEIHLNFDIANDNNHEYIAY